MTSVVGPQEGTTGLTARDGWPSPSARQHGWDSVRGHTPRCGTSRAGRANRLAGCSWCIRRLQSGFKARPVLWLQGSPGGTGRDSLNWEVGGRVVGALSTGPCHPQGRIHRQRWTKVHRTCRGRGVGQCPGPVAWSSNWSGHKF